MQESDYRLLGCVTQPKYFTVSKNLFDATAAGLKM